MIEIMILMTFSLMILSSPDFEWKKLKKNVKNFIRVKIFEF